MITLQTDIYPRIEWDILEDILERDPEERMVVRSALGKGDDGKQYSGSAYFFCGEIDEIKDIQEI